MLGTTGGSVAMSFDMMSIRACVALCHLLNPPLPAPNPLAQATIVRQTPTFGGSQAASSRHAKEWAASNESTSHALSCHQSV